MSGSSAAVGTGEADEAPLTFAQESMWFTDRLHGGYRGFTEPSAVRLLGQVDEASLAAALGDVVRAQPTLRARIAFDGRTPCQRIAPHVAPLLPVEDRDGEDVDAVVRREIAAESARRFDIERGPLWHVRLLRFGAADRVLLLTFHHVVTDMQSLRRFTRQLSQCYVARLNGAPAPGARPGQLPHAEYARRQHAALSRGELEPALAHWERALRPLPAPLVLPLDRPRPTTLDGDGDAVLHRLADGVTGRLRKHVEDVGVTPFMFLVSAYAVTLAAASGQREIVIGSPILHQPPEFADAIGPFVNVLPLRFEVTEEASFADLLEQTRTMLTEVLGHAEAPFEEIVRRINPPREPGRNPLFQVMVELGGSTSHDLQLPGVRAESIAVAPARSAFELSLHLAPHDNEIRCQFDYATALFDRDRIVEMAARFDAITRAALSAPHRRCGDLRDLPPVAPLGLEPRTNGL